MQCFMEFLIHVASTSGTIATRASLNLAACLAVLVCGLLPVSSAFGEDDHPSQSARNAVISDGAQPASPDQSGREQRQGPGSNDGLHHRSALGVLLDQLEDAVVVAKVIPGSPAERAGLSVGDEIRFV